MVWLYWHLHQLDEITIWRGDSPLISRARKKKKSIKELFIRQNSCIFSTSAFISVLLSKSGVPTIFTTFAISRLFQLATHNTRWSIPLKSHILDTKERDRAEKYLRRKLFKLSTSFFSNKDLLKSLALPPAVKNCSSKAQNQRQTLEITHVS